MTLSPRVTHSGVTRKRLNPEPPLSRSGVMRGPGGASFLEALPPQFRKNRGDQHFAPPLFSPLRRLRAGSLVPAGEAGVCATLIAALRFPHGVSAATVQSAPRMNLGGAPWRALHAAALASASVPVASGPDAVHASHKRPAKELRQFRGRQVCLPPISVETFTTWPG